MFALAVTGDVLGVIPEYLGGAPDPVVKVGLHLEQLAEIRIQREKELMDERGADDDDLCLERNGFRLEGDHGHELVLFQYLLDLDLAIANGAFERIPGEQIAEHL